MVAVAHRVVPNRSRELRERAWALVRERLGRTVICGRCGATYASYEDRCLSDLEGSCPGFRVIDAAGKAAARDVGLA